MLSKSLKTLADAEIVFSVEPCKLGLTGTGGAWEVECLSCFISPQDVTMAEMRDGGAHMALVLHLIRCRTWGDLFRPYLMVG